VTAGHQGNALRVLSQSFGFATFRPGQDRVIEALLAGRDVLAVMPTGAGKSLCYQVPALMRDGTAIVVSPLVALMKDQVAALRLNGIAAETINSSLSREDNVAAWRRVQGGAVKLLYMSPERLMTEQMLAAVARLGPSLIAVDEAHCISQWGPAFRPEYAALQRLRHLFPDLPIAALTATADPVTRDDIVEKLFDGRAETVVTGFDRPNLMLAVEMKRNWKKQMLDFVEAHRSEAGIVYCLSRRKTEEAAELLREAGHKAMPYHAGMDSQTRAAAQDRFMTEPGTVIAATIAFGMGIDKPDIRYVLHTDLPGSPEAYYQEIGRAGRDGEPADTLMLYGLDDIRMRRTFIEEENSGSDRKRREHKRLDALLAYCEAAECRRRMLLQYFGEAAAPCGRCDLCLNPVETVDATDDGQKILSAVYRTGQRWGAAHIVNILLGKHTDKTASSGHDRLPIFGAGADPPACRVRLPCHRHQGLWRAGPDGKGWRAAQGRGRIPLPAGHGPQTGPAVAAQGAGGGRGAGPGRARTAAGTEGPAVAPGPGPRRPGLRHLLRQDPDRHGRPPPGNPRGLRRGLRRRQCEAGAVRGHLPGGDRGVRERVRPPLFRRRGAATRETTPCTGVFCGFAELLSGPERERAAGWQRDGGADFQSAPRGAARVP
jgi:ATP-dependent DNA helicase RecQ